jgi:hypothetical protein
LISFECCIESLDRDLCLLQGLPEVLRKSITPRTDETDLSNVCK